MVQELVKKGYLKRATDPKDARSVHLTLSPRAHKELGVLQRAALKNFTKLFAVLSDREFSQYVALHQKLVRGCVP